MVFGRNFCEKLQIWVSEPHFGEVRGDERPSLMAREKSHGQLSIRVKWTFSLSITVPGLLGEMCTARLFSQGSTSLHWSLRDGEYRIPLRSVVLTQYWSVTDRQTDGRICRSIYRACGAL